MIDDFTLGYLFGIGVVTIIIIFVYWVFTRKEEKQK